MFQVVCTKRQTSKPPSVLTVFALWKTPSMVVLALDGMGVSFGPKSVCMHAVEVGGEVWAGLELPGLVLQKKPPRERDEMSSGASGSLSPSISLFNKHEWKYIASEKTTSKSIVLHLSLFSNFHARKFHSYLCRVPMVMFPRSGN